MQSRLYDAGHIATLLDWIPSESAQLNLAVLVALANIATNGGIEVIRLTIEDVISRVFIERDIVTSLLQNVTQQSQIEQLSRLIANLTEHGWRLIAFTYILAQLPMDLFTLVDLHLLEWTQSETLSIETKRQISRAIANLASTGLHSSSTIILNHTSDEMASLLLQSGDTTGWNTIAQLATLQDLEVQRNTARAVGNLAVHGNLYNICK